MIRSCQFTYDKKPFNIERVSGHLHLFSQWQVSMTTKLKHKWHEKYIFSMGRITFITNVENSHDFYQTPIKHCPFYKNIAKYVVLLG